MQALALDLPQKRCPCALCSPAHTRSVSVISRMFGKMYVPVPLSPKMMEDGVCMDEAIKQHERVKAAGGRTMCCCCCSASTCACQKPYAPGPWMDTGRRAHHVLLQRFHLRALRGRQRRHLFRCQLHHLLQQRCAARHTCIRCRHCSTFGRGNNSPELLHPAPLQRNHVNCSTAWLRPL